MAELVVCQNRTRKLASQRPCRTRRVVGVGLFTHCDTGPYTVHNNPAPSPEVKHTTLANAAKSLLAGKGPKSRSPKPTAVVATRAMSVVRHASKSVRAQCLVRGMSGLFSGAKEIYDQDQVGLLGLK